VINNVVTQLEEQHVQYIGYNTHQCMDEVSTLDVPIEFISVNKQRIMFFGHFD